MRRALQDRVLLPGHRVRHDIHRGISAEAVRGPEPVQVRAIRHVHHRRGRNPPVLHRPRYHRQRRRIRCFRYVARLPCVPDLQVLEALAGAQDPRLHVEIVRLGARFPSLLPRDGDHHIRNRHVLRGEERRWNELHLDTCRVLVHDRHDDHIRVSSFND